jgi:hypothetical protein
VDAKFTIHKLLAPHQLRYNFSISYPLPATHPSIYIHSSSPIYIPFRQFTLVCVLLQHFSIFTSILIPLISCFLFLTQSSAEAFNRHVRRSQCHTSHRCHRYRGRFGHQKLNLNPNPNPNPNFHRVPRPLPLLMNLLVEQTSGLR